MSTEPMDLSVLFAVASGGEAWDELTADHKYLLHNLARLAIREETDAIVRHLTTVLMPRVHGIPEARAVLRCVANEIASGHHRTPPIQPDLELVQLREARRIGEAIGYGNLITLARQLWAERLAPQLGEEGARDHVEAWGCDCEKCDEPIQALLQKWREASFRNPHDVTYERFANELEEALNG